jgi:outer membrane protein assembly factor BamB
LALLLAACGGNATPEAALDAGEETGNASGGGGGGGAARGGSGGGDTGNSATAGRGGSVGAAGAGGGAAGGKGGSVASGGTSGAGGMAATPPSAVPPSPSSTVLDVTTYQINNMRHGWNGHETALTPANVNVNSFGKIAYYKTDGIVTGQPLYLANVKVPDKGMHNIIYLVTETNSVYALDADTGAPIWNVKVMPAGEKTGHGCSNFLNQIGISATPVIERGLGPNGVIYVTPMSTDVGGKSHQRIYALDVATGAPMLGSPIEVTARFTSPSTGTVITMDPAQVAEVASLTLVHGVLVTTYGYPCEYMWPAHAGWVIAYDAKTLAQTSVFNTTPESTGGIIWMGGGAPAADAQGNIFVPTGRAGMGAMADALDQNGFPSKGDYTSSVIKLSTTGGALKVVDYAKLPGGDLDQMGAIAFDAPDAAGTVRHLLARNRGSDLYVFDRDNLGKSGPTPYYQYIKDGDYGAGVSGGPALFNNNILYFCAVWDPLKAFTITTAKAVLMDRNEKPTDQQGSGTPMISSNGANNAIIWKVDKQSGTQIFHAYDALHLGKLLYSSLMNPMRDGLIKVPVPNLPQNAAVTVVNGRVYAVDTGSAGVAVYGLFAP